jgi:hypothetical protein
MRSRFHGPFAALLATTLLCGILLTTSHCATHTAPSTTPILSPTAKALLVASLGSIQTAAIALAPVDGISQADTTTVVNTVALAISVIQGGQTGWLSAVDVLLAKLPTTLSASTAATLAPYLDAITAVIQDLYSTGTA